MSTGSREGESRREDIYYFVHLGNWDEERGLDDLCQRQAYTMSPQTPSWFLRRRSSGLGQVQGFHVLLIIPAYTRFT
jgi:hypothetical protein